MLKEIYRGFINGKQRIGCRQSTRGYQWGYRRGIRFSNLTQHERTVLTAKVCFVIAVLTLVLGMRYAYILYGQ